MAAVHSPGVLPDALSTAADAIADRVYKKGRSKALSRDGRPSGRPMNRACKKRSVRFRAAASRASAAFGHEAFELLAILGAANRVHIFGELALRVV